MRGIMSGFNLPRRVVNESRKNGMEKVEVEIIACRGIAFVVSSIVGSVVGIAPFYL